ncbi:MAG: hypothetical protein ABUT39_27830 [Acidobacteriota bacterium]
MKNLMAALLLAATFLTASVPAHAMEAAHGRRPGTGWVVRILGWLGLPVQALGSVWEASSAHIDPNGQPRPNGGGGTGAGSDSSANIDPNG